MRCLKLTLLATVSPLSVHCYYFVHVTCWLKVTFRLRLLSGHVPVTISGMASDCGLFRIPDDLGFGASRDPTLKLFLSVPGLIRLSAESRLRLPLQYKFSGTRGRLLACLGKLPEVEVKPSCPPVKQSMSTLSMLVVPKEEANSLIPVKELSRLIRLPYFGVSGLRGEIGLVKLAYKWFEFCEGCC